VLLSQGSTSCVFAAVMGADERRIPNTLVIPQVCVRGGWHHCPCLAQTTRRFYPMAPSSIAVWVEAEPTEWPNLKV
jgi:hypothetical protein